MTMTARFLPQYPKRIQTTGGITKTEANGVVTLGFDYSSSEVGAELQQAVDTANADAAQTAADKADAAASAAAAAASASVFVNATYDKISDAAAITPDTAPNALSVNGYAAAGDGGGGTYAKVDSEPTHDGKFSITLSDGTTVVWYELTENFPNELMFGGVASATNSAQTAAIQSLVDYCSAKGRSAWIVQGHVVTSNINVPDNVVIYGNAPFGQFLDLGFNGDILTVNSANRLYNIGLRGNGATWTGRGINIATGNDQVFSDCFVYDFASPCLEVADDVGARARVSGGFWQRHTATDPAIVMSNTETATSTDRQFQSINTGGGTLLDTGAADNFSILSCDCTNIIFRSGSHKGRIIGNRIANGAVPVTLTTAGLQHTFSGNIISGDVEIGSDNTAFDDSNIVAGTISDTSGTAHNIVSLGSAAYTPTVTGSGSNPTIGNSSLTGEYERDGHFCIARLSLVIGSSFAPGSGTYSFSLPLAPYAHTLDIFGKAVVTDSGTGFKEGVAVIASGSSVVTLTVGDGVVNNVGAGIPITWATGDVIRFEIRYRINLFGAA